MWISEALTRHSTWETVKNKRRLLHTGFLLPLIVQELCRIHSLHLYTPKHTRLIFVWIKPCSKWHVSSFCLLFWYFAQCSYFLPLSIDERRNSGWAKLPGSSTFPNGQGAKMMTLCWHLTRGILLVCLVTLVYPFLHVSWHMFIIPW